MAFKPGDLIWAKMRGYPHWPARIDLPAENERIPPKKFPIFFYGTHETAVMMARDLCDYEKHKSKYAKTSNRRFFNEALEEIIKDPKVRYGQRGKPVESESEQSSESEEENNEEEEDKDEEETEKKSNLNQVQKKRKLGTDRKTPSKKKKMSETEESESEPEESEPEESSESEEEEYVPEEKGKAKKPSSAKKTALNKSKQSKKIISSDDSSEDEKLENDEATGQKTQLKKQKRKSESGDSLISDEDKSKSKKTNKSARKESESDDKKKKSEDSNKNNEESEEERKKRKEEAEKRRLEKLEKKKEELKEKKRQEKLEQKAKQKEKEKRDKEKEKRRKEKELEKERILKEKQKEKERLEKEKQKERERQEREKQKEQEKIEWQKQRERLKNPTIYDTLQLCNQDLKLSLTVEAPDIHRCLNTLSKINELVITPDVIKKSPAIIQTIKKIRNYKPSNKVRERASELYTKLKSLFLVTGLDTPATPVTKTTAQKLFTPVDQKPSRELLSQAEVTSQKPVEVKTENQPKAEPTDVIKQEKTAELSPEKENLSNVLTTQNGGNSIENKADVEDKHNEPTDDKGRTLHHDVAMHDDQMEILTPCDMEISSPI